MSVSQWFSFGKFNNPFSNSASKLDSAAGQKLGRDFDSQGGLKRDLRRNVNMGELCFSSVGTMLEASGEIFNDTFKN